jgi:hypothetical protein
MRSVEAEPIGWKAWDGHLCYRFTVSRIEPLLIIEIISF